MRTQALKLLRQEFRRLLLNRCHMFRYDAAYRGSPGADLYLWQISSNLNCFIHLLPNPKSYRDSFMVELAWSGGEYPIQAPLQNMRKLNVLSDGRVRLPDLWREQWPSAVEPWWELGSSLTATNEGTFYTDEETARRVDAVPKGALDAVDKIEKYAIPLFHKIAAERAASGTNPAPLP